MIAIRINPKRIKTLTNFWVLRNWVEHTGARAGNNMLQIKIRNKNELTVDPGLILVDMLTAFEKIGDFCYNITQAVAGIK